MRKSRFFWSARSMHSSSERFRALPSMESVAAGGFVWACAARVNASERVKTVVSFITFIVREIGVWLSFRQCRILPIGRIGRLIGGGAAQAVGDAVPFQTFR